VVWVGLLCKAKVWGNRVGGGCCFVSVQGVGVGGGGGGVVCHEIRKGREEDD